MDSLDIITNLHFKNNKNKSKIIKEHIISFYNFFTQKKSLIYHIIFFILMLLIIYLIKPVYIIDKKTNKINISKYIYVCFLSFLLYITVFILTYFYYSFISI